MEPMTDTDHSSDSSGCDAVTNRNQSLHIPLCAQSSKGHPRSKFPQNYPCSDSLIRCYSAVFNTLIEKHMYCYFINSF